MASSFIVTRETKSGVGRPNVSVFQARDRRLGLSGDGAGLQARWVPHYQPHDLIAAPTARRAGRQHGRAAREAAHRAGHSRTSESLDTYSHVMPLDELAAERLRALMGS